MTPHQALRIMESKPDLSEEERAKGLAITLTFLAKTWVEVNVLWEQSALVIRANGFPIRDFDFDFVKSATGND